MTNKLKAKHGQTLLTCLFKAQNQKKLNHTLKSESCKFRNIHRAKMIFETKLN